MSFSVCSRSTFESLAKNKMAKKHRTTSINSSPPTIVLNEPEPVGRILFTISSSYWPIIFSREMK